MTPSSLRALLEGATPRPWRADDDGTAWWSDGAGDIAKIDARLIVAAVNALLHLVALWEAAEAHAGECCGCCHSAYPLRDALAALKGMP